MCSAFGLLHDATKPVTRMLPGSSPCELRQMLPDDELGIDGFHDILVENLSGTPACRSSHVTPADMTSLRRRWPKAVFNTLRRRASDVERLRRDAPKRADKAFRYGGPGFCGVCNIRIYSALDVRSHDSKPSRTRSAVALPCHMVRGVEGVGACVPGTSGPVAWGISAENND